MIKFEHGTPFVAETASRGSRHAHVLKKSAEKLEKFCENSRGKSRSNSKLFSKNNRALCIQSNTTNVVFPRKRGLVKTDKIRTRSKHHFGASAKNFGNNPPKNHDTVSNSNLGCHKIEFMLFLSRSFRLTNQCPDVPMLMLPKYNCAHLDSRLFVVGRSA